ncbi:hypothetical protein N7454_008870 [Penicillium verhagenii]|nr:hypothetical protein N7454_008870 [Penicillium verhagenii]
MSLGTLSPNGLYILLYIRHHPPVPNNFHWAFYFHISPQQGGTKYHVKDIGQGWIPDHGVNHAVMKEFLLVGLFQIAHVPTGQEEYLDRIMRTFDGRLNVPETTCRIWILWVLALLQGTVDGRRLLECDDVQALEEEIKDWGNENAMGAANNEQPRPVGRSSLCRL